MLKLDEFEQFIIEATNIETLIYCIEKKYKDMLCLVTETKRI